MRADKLRLTELRGTTTRSCGAEYGRLFEHEIMGFCRAELKPDQRKLDYASRCWPLIETWAPQSASFMKGMAQGAHLSLEHVVLLALHEEIGHMPHCTAFGATGAATRGGKAILAQNWDWATNLYPWAGLLRYAIRGKPRILTYQYPGLWASAGINEHGLALMWTGAGYMPRIRPVVGVPTYVIIAELLHRRSVKDALDYLGRVKHAGSFIFFLGDTGADVALVEAVPRAMEVVRGVDILTRGNHYMCDRIRRFSRQRIGRGTTTAYRTARMEKLVQQYRGRLTTAAAKRILTDRHGKYPWLHQLPGGPKGHELAAMTVDSLIAVCQDRILHTCRGGRVAGPWQTVAV